LRDVERLVTDPYAVYADKLLRLRPLAPLSAAPDRRDRGAFLHDLQADLLAAGLDPAAPDARARLLDLAARRLADGCDWPVTRRVWLAHAARIAEAFLRGEAERAAFGGTNHAGATAEAVLPGSGVTLAIRVDRVDVAGGRLRLIDYCSGAPPTETTRARTKPGLLIAAALARRGAFDRLGAREVAAAAYVSFDPSQRPREIAVDEARLAETWTRLDDFLRLWSGPARGYSARLAADGEEDEPYDHLARFGEWDRSTPATPIDLG
jgi:RecB family exonuclease